MPSRIIWNDAMDATLRAMRAEGANWLEVSDRLGVEVKAAMRRARKLGIPTGRLNIGPVSGRAVMAGVQPTTRPINQSAREKWERVRHAPANP